MNRLVRPAGFPAFWLVPQLLVLARETFEAGVAIRYDAPWKRPTAPGAASADPVS